jgi:5-methylcytosine-specific restriction endonuclease McrA
MLVEENFELCAQRLFDILHGAQRISPDTPRVLYFYVNGHRGDGDSYDRDASEIMEHYIPKFLGPFLTRWVTPLAEYINPHTQQNDMPRTLTIRSAADSNDFDVMSLKTRSRESVPEDRKSPPTAEAIADYLGMSSPCCLICSRGPVDRAHVIPRSLHGSFDIRNFALLCKRHHEEAPDIADAEAFWTWIDFAYLREHRIKLNTQADADLHSCIDTPYLDRIQNRPDNFMTAVKDELIDLYGWHESEFSRLTWDLENELHIVLDNATGSHFNVRRKVSTYAWAWNTARNRIRQQYQPPDGN